MIFLLQIIYTNKIVFNWFLPFLKGLPHTQDILKPMKSQVLWIKYKSGWHRPVKFFFIKNSEVLDF